MRQRRGRAPLVAPRPPELPDCRRCGSAAGAGSRRVLWWRLPFARPLTIDRLLAGRLGAPLSVVPDEPGLYWASVALILAPSPDSVLVIRRAHREGDPWSGHMALPGGRRESGDADLVAAAIRETAEEVGVELTREDLLGVLADVVPRTPVLPPIAVRPHVFRVSSRPALRLNEEIAAAVWLPVADLQPHWRADVVIEVAGASRVTPAFVTPDGVIWGMTERILRDLLDRIENSSG